MTHKKKTNVAVDTAMKHKKRQPGSQLVSQHLIKMFCPDRKLFYTLFRCPWHPWHPYGDRRHCVGKTRRPWHFGGKKRRRWHCGAGGCCRRLCWRLAHWSRTRKHILRRPTQSTRKDTNTHTHTHTHTHTSTHKHTHTFKHAKTRTHTHTHMRAHMHAHTRTRNGGGRRK